MASSGIISLIYGDLRPESSSRSEVVDGSGVTKPQGKELVTDVRLHTPTLCCCLGK